MSNKNTKTEIQLEISSFAINQVQIKGGKKDGTISMEMQTPNRTHSSKLCQIQSKKHK